MIEIKPETLMVTLTVDQFMNLQRDLLSSHEEKIKNETKILFESLFKEKEKDDTDKYVYGLKGLAKLLQVSKSKAWRIKVSGDIDKAIFQNGSIIRFDKQLASELYYKSISDKE